MSMNTASLLTTPSNSLPEIFLSSGQSKPHSRDSAVVSQGEAKLSTKQGKRPHVAVHGPGSLARHHVETHEAGEILGKLPSVLARTNSVKLGYYQWKKKHPWSYPKPKVIMKSIIQEKHSMLEGLRKRAELLESENHRIMLEIKHTDKQMDIDSRNLLEKHEQFMEKLAKLKQGYETEVEMARNKAEERRQVLKRDMDKMENVLRDEDKFVKIEQDHLSSLISYQQKEYPLKAMAIYDLKGQQVRLRLIQEEEVRDLNNLVEEETEKMKEKANQEKIEIFKKITDIAIKNTPDKVVTLLQENQVLREEISTQQEHIDRMTDEVNSLTNNVYEIKKRWKQREQEKIHKIKTSDDADLEINGDSLNFPRQPTHIII
ncbi:hypothetical protein LOD99_3197 [Oopsacas minuta]|uniref:Uncharacterized protein n=1 Tax=Oopsacas minuta TaxID=111878 RepID=A0AAV7JYA8_9METZ|nr:hypothetical protein LOD99_3197 [Oopsacas minuta]